MSERQGASAPTGENDPPVVEHIADPWGLLLAGLIAVRVVTTGHAPTVVDAAIAGGLALLLLRAALVGGGVDRAAMAVIGGAFVVGLVSTLTSVHPLVSTWALPGFLAPFLAFAAVRTEDGRSRQRVMVALALAGLLHSAVALYQRLLSYPDALARADALGLDPAARATLAMLRPLGLTLSPDLAGGLALVTALLGLALLTARTDAVTTRGHRAVGSAALVVGLGALVASRSAGTALALLVAVIVLLWAARGGALSRRVLTGIAATALLSAGLAFRGLGALGASATERLTNWGIAFELGLDHPLGVGLARFGPAYLAARPAQSNVTLYAHSTWLQAWAELGVPGALLVIVIVVAGVRAIVRMPVVERAARALPLALLGALTARASYDYDLQVGQCAVVFGAVAGLALVRQPDQEAPLSRARSTQLLTAVLTVVTLLPLKDLGPREGALAPFERGGDEREQDIGALIRFADAHPGDVVANAVAARLELFTLRRCHEGAGCERIERSLRERVDLADDLAPADALHVSAAHLALLRGDPDGAQREARAALDDHGSSLAAWQILVEVAQPQGPAAVRAIVDEASPWLLPHERARLVPPTDDAPPP